MTWFRVIKTVEPSPSDRTEETPAAQQTTRQNPLCHCGKSIASHWPRTCEKLMNDQRGYMSRAGDKLVAAVQDGLRVLAITGSRRGEGRTMLSLYLGAGGGTRRHPSGRDGRRFRPPSARQQNRPGNRVRLARCSALEKFRSAKPRSSRSAMRSRCCRWNPRRPLARCRWPIRVTATIRAAAATFELLILDLGPLAAGEKIEFPPGEGCPLDAAIVVRDQRFSTVIESETIGRVLHDAGLEAVGIAENFVIEEDIPVTSV